MTTSTTACTGPRTGPVSPAATRRATVAGRRRPEEYPQQGAHRETESYDQPRGYTRTGGHPPAGNYDETDLHPTVKPGDPPRRGTVRRYGAARQDSTDLFPAASQAGAGWIEPDFATGEIAAVEAGWRANTGQWTVPVRRPGAARQAPPAAEPSGESITRSSGVMAIGTLASRGTGLLRTLVQSTRSARRAGQRLQQCQHAA